MNRLKSARKVARTQTLFIFVIRKASEAAPEMAMTLAAERLSGVVM